MNNICLINYIGPERSRNWRRVTVCVEVFFSDICRHSGGRIGNLCSIKHKCKLVQNALASLLSEAGKQEKLARERAASSLNVAEGVAFAVIIASCKGLYGAINLFVDLLNESIHPDNRPMHQLRRQRSANVHQTEELVDKSHDQTARAADYVSMHPHASGPVTNVPNPEFDPRPVNARSGQGAKDYSAVQDHRNYGKGGRRKRKTSEKDTSSLST